MDLIYPVNSILFKLTCVSVSDNTIVQLSQACTISTAYLAVEV